MEKLSLTDSMKALFMQSECMAWHPRVQVCGLFIIFDLNGASAKTIMALQNSKDQADRLKYFQECLPIRMKTLVYLNEPPIFDALLKVFEQFMSAKMKQRIIRCKHDIGIAIEKFPGLKEILPKEYGGNGQEIDKIYDEKIKDFIKYWKNGAVWPVSVNEERRLGKCGLDKFHQIQEKEGTYVKLDQQF